MSDQDSTTDANSNNNQNQQTQQSNSNESQIPYVPRDQRAILEKGLDSEPLQKK